MGMLAEERSLDEEAAAAAANAAIAARILNPFCEILVRHIPEIRVRPESRE